MKRKLLSTIECLLSVLAGVVARRRTELVEVVESLRGRMSEGDREASPSGERQVEGLFESLLSESFG
jgi:hypothetical protein